MHRKEMADDDKAGWEHKSKQQRMRNPAIVAGVVIFLALYVFPAWVNPPLHMDYGQRLSWVLPYTLVPVTVLAVRVMQLSFHRISSPNGIDAALKPPSREIIIMQSIIQNTLEQLLIAVPVYMTAAVRLRPHRLMAIPAAASLFMAGRISFVLGYKGSSPGRAYGFITTVIPSLLLLFETLLMCMLSSLPTLSSIREVLDFIEKLSGHS